MAVVIVVTKVMNYLYIDDTDEFSRYMLHEFYEEEENIDRLYLGSSHVFCGINPVILDDINGENNFNLSTGMQQLNTSYYLLKEADKRHNIDKVYLDLYYGCTIAGTGNLHDYHMLPYSWVVINQMKPSFNKLSYMLDLSKPEYYYMTFLAFTRYKEQLFDRNYVAGVVKGKRSETWKNYEYRHIYHVDDREYIMRNGEKGFRIYNGRMEAGGFYRIDCEAPLEENPITLESLEYLDKIVKYCEKHDIELTWIGCPISNFQLVRNGKYDNYIRQVSELAGEYDIPYYDFNLCKSEYLDLSQDKYWADMGHLNTEGAEVFTRFLGDFLRSEEEGEETYNDCFYDSYEEKIRVAQKEIYGLEIVKSQEYEQAMPDIPQEQWEEYVIYKIRSVANAPKEDVVIDVSMVKDNSVEQDNIIQTIQAGDDIYVVFPAQEHGEMRVEAKLKGAAEATNWVQIEY